LGEVEADVRDAVSIAVSELATNAVLYAQTEFDVRVALDDERLRVEVIDGGAGSPEIQEAPPASEVHGRGLLLVSKFANEWGIVSSPDRAGKTVWFEIKLNRTKSACQ
jgi:anti-sigma regulatory factor (Ser/Thr protein kinase)